MDALVRSLTANEWETRSRAARELGERGDPSAVPALILVLERDSSAVVRGWAVRALDQLGTPEAREAVAAAAQSDTDPRVRELAIRVAGLASRPIGERRAHEIAPPRAEAIEDRGEEAEGASAEPTESEAPAPGRRTIAYGWGILGASYGLALLSGTVLMTLGEEELLPHAWKLYLPVVGPIVAATTAMREPDFVTLSALHWIWSGIQITGLVVLVVGYVQQRRAGRERTASGDRHRGAGPRVLISPSGPAGSAGLTLGGWFD
jgi:hypothetical protein